ncbi:inositol polyphosphate 5-phosphatase, partial [Blyttiomyces sp. JEL0837]
MNDLRHLFDRHHIRGDSISVPITKKKLRIYIPPKGLRTFQHLPSRFDVADDNNYHLIVIGTQECQRLERSWFASATWQWLRYLSDQLGDRYCLVRTEEMGGLHLAVFVERRNEKAVTAVSSGRVATGFGAIIGNKGAVAVGLKFLDTSLVFVNAHFSGNDRTSNRNSNYNRINREMKLKHFNCGRSSKPLSSSFDYVFWFGDLNYRVNGTRHMVDKLLESSRYEASVLDERTSIVLINNDQLSHEIKKGKVFLGFQEAKINFPPTYKFDKAGNGDRYDTSSKSRIPSWTDRILYKCKCDDRPEDDLSMSSFAECDAQAVTSMKVERYESIGDVCFSDHKPVVGIFELMQVDVLDAEKNFGSRAMSDMGLEFLIAREVEKANLPMDFNVYNLCTTSEPAESSLFTSLKGEKTTQVQRLVLLSERHNNPTSETFIYGLSATEIQTWLSTDDAEAASTSPTIKPPRKRTLVYVEKVDSSGFYSLAGRKLASPIGILLRCYTIWLIDIYRGTDLSLHTFARAQPQLLFPNSARNERKHVLKERELISWWFRTLDGLAAGCKADECWWFVPGEDVITMKDIVNRSCSGLMWKWGLVFGSDELASQVVPRFPDDAKTKGMKLVGPSGTVSQLMEMLSATGECGSGRLSAFFGLKFPTGEAQVTDGEHPQSIRSMKAAGVTRNVLDGIFDELMKASFDTAEAACRSSAVFAASLTATGCCTVASATFSGDRK